MSREVLEKATQRWHARAAKYDPENRWYNKTVLRLHAICRAARTASETVAAQHAAELPWRLVSVEV